MDPNATLETIREYARQTARGENVRQAEREIRWTFEELDQWLSRGGFFPEAWTCDAPWKG